MSEKKFENIKDYYEDLYAEKKGESFPHDNIRTSSFLTSFVPAKDKDSLSLDIGCGVGYACKIMQDAGYKPYGIDISAGALEHAKKRLPNSIFNLAAESNIMDHKDDFFDAISCLGVLEHIDNPEVIVSEAFRVLKPNGRALFLVPNSLSPYFMIAGGTGQIMEETRSLGQWQKMFEASGFNLVNVSKDIGPTIIKEYSLIKKLKIVLHRILNILPVNFTYQMAFLLEKKS